MTRAQHDKGSGEGDPADGGRSGGQGPYDSTYTYMSAFQQIPPRRNVSSRPPNYDVTAINDLKYDIEYWMRLEGYTEDDIRQ